MPKNIKHGLDDCKWTKETGLVVTPLGVCNSSSTLHFPLKLNVPAEEETYYTLFMIRKLVFLQLITHFSMTSLRLGNLNMLC